METVQLVSTGSEPAGLFLEDLSVEPLESQLASATAGSFFTGGSFSSVGSTGSSVSSTSSFSSASG